MTLSVSQLLCFVRKKKTCEPVDPQIIAVAGDQVLTIERSHNIEFNKKSLEEFYLKSQTAQQHLKKNTKSETYTGESGMVVVADKCSVWHSAEGSNVCIFYERKLRH